jgi:hypothetical protein
MGTHTPGPWAITREDHAHAIVSEEFVIADVFTFQPDCAGVRTDAEGEANARLIASAPDLLDALQAVVNDLEMWPGEKNPEFFESMKAARTALAKAKGV